MNTDALSNKIWNCTHLGESIDFTYFSYQDINLFCQLHHLQSSRWTDHQHGGEIFLQSLMERIILFSKISSHYFFCGCYWCDMVHVTGKVELVFSVLTLEEDRSKIQSYGLWYTWGFFCREGLSWGHQVACYILCLPSRMSFKDKVNGEH